MKPACRFCGSADLELVLSLGTTPLANSNIPPERLAAPETYYPLDLKVCRSCKLAQLDDWERPEAIFTDYVYFSSWSTSWLAHARAYVETVTDRFHLDRRSHVVEIASNDGYLLQYFVERGIPVLGIEPAANVAAEAVNKGIPTRVAFWSAECARRLAAEGKHADLVVGNNVLAHVPDPNGFVEGLPLLLKPGGVLTMEFPHLYRLVEGTQFDTIYHEHFSYFSFFVVQALFKTHGLTVFDVEELRTHGGSLRVYAQRTDTSPHPVSGRVEALLGKERTAGMHGMGYYRRFAENVHGVKRALLRFLLQARDNDKLVVGYGAPAKGNTLLNYCGIRSDLLAYTVDRSPHKQGLYTPGTRIPILSPDAIRADKPDYVLILPWNLREEIMEQMAHIREWGGRFVVPVPRLAIID